ncbi:crocetin glucosyltransferase, chloroplastic-like [Iris pallida]|uniref:Crocetin glucosyltransferase, chloroplastic-like n=1 Tax=Iris pallida TaxID=29817 RepID=A0AAX6GVJ7_IRIPA|nr:crocetin glucosyltransferase, chloroplastic-like [Iris pallida]
MALSSTYPSPTASTKMASWRAPTTPVTTSPSSGPSAPPAPPQPRPSRRLRRLHLLPPMGGRRRPRQRRPVRAVLDPAGHRLPHLLPLLPRLLPSYKQRLRPHVHHQIPMSAAHTSPRPPVLPHRSARRPVRRHPRHAEGHVRHSRQRACAVEFETDCFDEHVCRAGGGRALRCPGPSLDPDRSHPFSVGRSRTRFVQAGREGVHGVAGLEAPRLGRVRVVREHDSLEEGADGGDPERAEGQRAAVPVGAAEGVQMGGAGAAGRRRERHGGRVVLAGGGAVASFGRVLRDALRVELDLREPGLRSADSRGAAVDGPGDERHAGGEDLGDRSEGRGQRGWGVGT